MSTSLGQLDVKVLSPVIEAGIATTIDLIIRNPFDKTISILAIKGPGSSAIRETKSRIEESKESQNLQITRPETSSLTPRQRVSKALSAFKISEVSIAGITARFPEKEKREVRIIAEQGAKVEWNRPIPDDVMVKITAGENSIIKFQSAPEEFQREAESIQKVSAGAEVIASFELITTRWLLFKPLDIILHAQIEYQIEDVVKSQVVPVPISIKAPLRSILIGANLGAMFGFLARQIKDKSLLPPSFQVSNFTIGILGAFVMATIATVAFARKQSAQGFITIEDFYGGFLIGALVGYFGVEYFEQVIQTSSSKADR
jgi:uncharacterized membrane protein YeaQ/YmgE (transglycosylase-associated protein family)